MGGRSLCSLRAFVPSWFFPLLAVVMISLTQPQPLAQAIASVSAKTPIGSALKSADWERVPVALRESAQFSAGVESARVLQRIQDRLLQMVKLQRSVLESGAEGAFFDRQKFIVELRELAIDEGLTPVDPTERDTLRDITSEARLGLIFDIQTQRAAEFAKWKMEQDEDVLDAYPAQELIRLEERVNKRRWIARWQGLGGKLFAGRMIAKKNDPIWRRLSRFQTPWPPFDFNSGMGLDDIGRDEAEDLGVLARDERVAPAEADFNEGMQASVRGFGERLRRALQTIFGDQVDVSGDVAKWKGQVES